MNTLLSLLITIIALIITTCIFILAEHKEEVWETILYKEDKKG